MSIDQDNPIIVDKKEQHLSTRDQVISFFSEKSGVPPEDVEHALGEWIVGQLDTLPDQAILQHYQDTDPTGQRLVDDFHKYQMVAPTDAQALFWRDLCTKRYTTDPNFKTYVDTVSGGNFKDVLTTNAAALLKEYLQLYNSDSKPSFAKALDDETKQRIINDAGSPENAAARIQHVQEGLEQAFKQGAELFTQGYIPVYRLLFFSDEEKKKDFMDQYLNGEDFQPQNHETALDAYSLHSVEDHTQAKHEGSPLDSWTYVPPNAEWRFGQKKLARVPAVMLMSKIAMKDTLYAKRFGGVANVAEEWNYIDADDAGKTNLSDSTSLKELQSKGKKGVFVPNEGEITMWGPQSNDGLIDLGP